MYLRNDIFLQAFISIKNSSRKTITNAKCLTKKHNFKNILRHCFTNNSYKYAEL